MLRSCVVPHAACQPVHYTCAAVWSSCWRPAAAAASQWALLLLCPGATSLAALAHPGMPAGRYDMKGPAVLLCAYFGWPSDWQSTLEGHIVQGRPWDMSAEALGLCLHAGACPAGVLLLGLHGLWRPSRQLRFCKMRFWSKKQCADCAAARNPKPDALTASKRALTRLAVKQAQAVRDDIAKGQVSCQPAAGVDMA